MDIFLNLNLDIFFFFLQESICELPEEWNKWLAQHP